MRIRQICLLRRFDTDKMKNSVTPRLTSSIIGMRALTRSQSPLPWVATIYSTYGSLSNSVSLSNSSRGARIGTVTSVIYSMSPVLRLRNNMYTRRRSASFALTRRIGGV